MALTKAQVKEILSEAGVDAEKMSKAVDKIMDGHLASIDALREERDNYKKDAEALPKVQKELDDIKANTKDDGYKEKFEKLKKEHDEFKAEVAKKQETANKVAEARKILKAQNIPDKYFDKILKYSADEIEQIKIGEDGKVDAEAFKNALKSDWSDYSTKDTTKGASTATPPESNGGSGKTYASKEEIMAIKDPTARQQAIADNHSLFGI